MNSASSISAVIPAFNNADIIAEALESVAAQTVKVSEAVVVDDGSSDGTAEVAGATLERLGLSGAVLRQANAGPAAARNRGVAAAKGEWIAFLDADDEWFPWRIEVQAELSGASPSVVCWCGKAVRKDEPGAEKQATDRPVRSLFRRVGVEGLLANNPVATSTVLVRRRELNAVGGFDQAFRGPEDFDLWLRLAATEPLAFIETPLARYRHRPGSLSLDDRRFLPEVLRVLEKAFGAGGVLQNRQRSRPLAESTQYWNASWMAFVRGDRRAALSLWWTAWRLNRKSAEPARRPWFRLLVRYSVGRMNVDPATRRGSDRATGL